MIEINVFDLFATITLTTTAYESGLNAARNATNNFGTASNKILNAVKAAGAAALTATSAAAIKFGKDAITAGMNFDSAMSKVSAISGATGKDFDALRDKAQEMGAKTKFSATESANAFEYMAMAGWKTEDMLSGIEGIMNLAAASGEDLATTSDIVTDALTAFGLKAKDSGHFADILAVASSNANTNVSMMGETFKYVAPVAGSMGVSAEDTAEAIGLMANAGIKASQAGTSLRSILTRLSTNAGASSKSLGALDILTQELGVDFYDSQGKVRDFGDILSEARAQWKSLSDEDAATFAKKIAGQEGISAWLAIMNAAPEDIKKLQTAIENCDGAAANMADTMQDNLAGDITIFKSALEGAQIALTDKITPSFRTFVKTATSGMSDFTESFKAGDIEGSFERIGIMIGQLVTKIVQKIPEAIESGVAFIEGVGKGFLKTFPYLLVTVANGIGQVLSGIAKKFPDFVNAGLHIIKNLTNGIKNKLSDLIPVAMEAIMNFSNTLREKAGELISAGIELIVSLAKGLIDGIPAFIETVPTIISNLAGIINDNAPKILAAGVELVVYLAKGLISAIPTLIKEAPKIIKAIVNVWTAFNWAALGKNAITFIKNGIISLKDTLPSTLKEIGTNAMNFFHNVDWHGLGQKVISLIYKGITTVINNLPELLEKIGKTAVTLFLSIDWAGTGKKVIKAIADAISSVFELVVNALKDVGTKAFNKFSSIDWKSLGTELIKALANGITGALKTALNAARDAANNIADTIKNKISGTSFVAEGTKMLNTIVSKASETVSKAKEAVANIVDKIKSKITGTNFAATGYKMIHSVFDRYSELLTAAYNVASGIGQRILNVLSGFSLFNVGQNLISGLWNGISNKAQWLYSQISNMGSTIVNKVKALFGVHSPSTVFASIGGYLAEGLGLGWNKEIPNVIKDVEKSLDFNVSPLSAGIGLSGDGYAETGVSSAAYTQDMLYQLLSKISTQLDEMNADICNSVDASGNTQITLNGREVGRVVRQYA